MGKWHRKCWNLPFCLHTVYFWLIFFFKVLVHCLNQGGKTNLPCYYCPFKPVPLNHCKCQCMEYRPKITNKCLVNLHWQLKRFTPSLSSFYSVIESFAAQQMIFAAHCNSKLLFSSCVSLNLICVYIQLWEMKCKLLKETHFKTVYLLKYVKHDTSFSIMLR